MAPVADAVGAGPRCVCDGGVRRGSDIVKAVAAGGDARDGRRAYLYALGAAGERGVDRMLEWFRADLIRTMSLVGVADVKSSTEGSSTACLVTPAAPRSRIGPRPTRPRCGRAKQLVSN